MVRTAILLILLSVSAVTYAQETVELSNSLSSGVIEKYHALKSNNEVKQGFYQAIYKKKWVVASGNYDQGKKTGVWHFFDPKGQIVQHYNYSTKQLLFQAPEDTSQYKMEYDFVKKEVPGDTISRPVRIGGAYYGYLPYLKHFKIDNQTLSSINYIYGVLQLLISPNGRLAECKLLVKSKQTSRIVDSYLLNTELLSEEDRTFFPGKVNHVNASANIYILCKIQPNGSISIY